LIIIEMLSSAFLNAVYGSINSIYVSTKYLAKNAYCLLDCILYFILFDYVARLSESSDEQYLELLYIHSMSFLSEGFISQFQFLLIIKL